MADMVTPNPTLVLGLDDIVAGFLTAAKVTLFQNDFVPTRSSVLADFTIADYSGFATENVTWLAPSIADDGTPEVVGTVGEFRPTGSTVENSIYGAILLTTAGAYLGAWRFDNPPLPMGSVLDSIVLTVRVRLALSGPIVVVS